MTSTNSVNVENTNMRQMYRVEFTDEVATEWVAHEAAEGMGLMGIYTSTVGRTITAWGECEEGAEELLEQSMDDDDRVASYQVVM